MNNCIGILNYSKLESEFGELCKNRAVYMLPFAGRYRMIDINISNMVNNGIDTVAVFTGDKIRSTMDHLGNGKPWNLNSRFRGLFLFPPEVHNQSISRLGDIADFYSALNFLKRSREENVLIACSNILYKDDLEKAYKHFLESKADITFLYAKIHDDRGEYINVDKIHLNEDGTVSNIGVNLGTEASFNMYLDSMLIKKDVLIRIIEEAVEKGNARSLKNAIMVNSNLFYINAHEVNGFVENIRDVDSYYRANLSLLNSDAFRKLFYENGKVMTKTKDEPSTIYRELPQVEGCLIANGCEIEGDVENSIIFRGVKIGKNAIVKNSIIMQKSVIEDGAIIVNAILDKNVKVGKNVSLVGSINQPFVIGKNQIVRRD